MMQAAYHGKTVTGYDTATDLPDRLAERWEWMRGCYRRDLADFDEQRFDAAVQRIRVTGVLEAAVADADLVIEAVPENLDLKRTVWAQVGAAAPATAIFATNTSTLRPSDFADATGAPERFLALHFANLIWRYNIGEVMRTPRTDPQVFDEVLRFAAEIGLESIAVYRETPEYVFNGLLGPLLRAAAALYIDGVATPSDIDRVWRTGIGSPRGPFEIFDMVGFNVAYNIFRTHTEDRRLLDFASLLKDGIDAGRTGLADRSGFYRYDAEGNRGAPVESWIREIGPTG